MNHSIEKSLYHLSGNGSLESVSESDIKSITEKYPWFTVGHALHSKKLNELNNSNFQQQIKKATLYFNNPLWFQYLLFNQNSFHLQERENNIPEIVLPNLEKVNKEEVEQIQEELTQAEELTSTAASEFVENETNSHVESTIEHSEDNLQSTTATLDSLKEELETTLEENVESEKVNNLEDEVNNTEMMESNDQSNEEPIELPKFNFTPLTDEQAKEAALEITAEPYHTIDYFDSQGIKVNLDEGKQDKLSHQLRRFTDWLKHMKAIGPEDALEAIQDPQLESTIQGIAEGSNASREIVTETMADVLVKQGKIDKAIQLYIKLSFLNPDKSPYFASKIQELKGISQ
jgi:hypothetical protein